MALVIMTISADKLAIWVLNFVVCPSFLVLPMDPHKVHERFLWSYWYGLWTEYILLLGCLHIEIRASTHSFIQHMYKHTCMSESVLIFNHA